MIRDWVPSSIALIYWRRHFAPQPKCTKAYIPLKIRSLNFKVVMLTLVNEDLWSLCHQFSNQSLAKIGCIAQLEHYT
jgi:hypothetical protein